MMAETVCVRERERERDRGRDRNRWRSRRRERVCEVQGGAPIHRWLRWLKGLFVPARAQVGYRLNELKKCSCN